jgi:hypothetical protein
MLVGLLLFGSVTGFADSPSPLSLPGLKSIQPKPGVARSPAIREGVVRPPVLRPGMGLTQGHKSTLLVCHRDCDGELDRPVASLNHPAVFQTRTYNFRWFTEAPDVVRLLWQVSDLPFENDRQVDSGRVVATGLLSVDGQKNGSLRIDLGDVGVPTSIVKGPAEPALSDPEGVLRPRITPSALEGVKRVGPTITGLRKATVAPWFTQPRDLPRTFHVRFFPLGEKGPLGPASTTVRMEFKGPPPPDIEIAPPFPKLYEVRILRFEDIKPPTLDWGCVHVESVDPPPEGALGNPLFELYDGYRKSGAPLCPEAYRGRGSPPWYEGLWETMVMVVSWPSEQFASLKSGVIDLVADSLNAVTGVEICNDWCRDRLRNSLDAGLVALGVPPTLPNAEELLADGKGYLVTVLAEQAGLEDCADCNKAISDGLDRVGKELTAKRMERTCDAEEAHRNGKEPLCLPSWVKATPASESYARPASVVVQVRRYPNVADLGPSSLDAYRLSIRFEATNKGLPEALTLQTATCDRDGWEFQCEPERFPIGGQLTGPVFRPVDMAVPRLGPGQQIDIPITLTPASFFVPGHYARVREKGTYLRFDDWPHLYQGADLQVLAEIDCPETTLLGSQCRHEATLTARGLGRF